MKPFATATPSCSDRVVTTCTALARKLSVTVLAVAAIGLAPAAAFAKGPPDGQTPSQESVCTGLKGAEYGLCNAYCEATDCGDGVNYASMHACASLQKNWQKKTGLDVFPCDCEEGQVFTADGGCECGHDLVVRIIDFSPGECPTGQGSCTYEMDIEVENLGTQDIVEPFDVLVELPGVGLGNSVNFPAGLGAGATEQSTAIPLGPGDNCFDPNCEVQATADPGNVIQECDEDNNVDFMTILG